jgi:general L-amino acid transport system substrate-binding protein
VALISPAGAASDTAARVRAAGALRCGVPESLSGFAEKDSAGRYRGFSADFCRAVAAAVLGDPEKVAFIPVSAAGRFPLLLSGRIDLLAHTSTWTVSREAGIGVRFPGIYFYDGQGFMAPAGGARRIEDLGGAAICVEKSTTHVPNLEDEFARRGIAFTAKILETLASATAALFEAKCQALTADRSVLAALRVTAPGGAEAWRVLPDTISREPLAPAVRRGDDEWETLVRWVLNALVIAEYRGLGRATVRRALETPTDPLTRRLAEDSRAVGRSLGIAPDWYVRVVEATGNYAEVYDRNVGTASPLKIERGPNRLWTEGGLLYSPPFR